MKYAQKIVIFKLNFQGAYIFLLLLFLPIISKILLLVLYKKIYVIIKIFW